MTLSNYLENELLDHILGTGAYTAPSTRHVQLHTGDPGEDCTANVATENTRQAVTFGAAAAKVISNDAAVSWTSVAATETYTHFSIWDASTGGNPLAYGTLSGGAVNSGDDFTIAIGGIDLTASTAWWTNYAANAALDHVFGGTAWTMPTGQFIKLHTGAPGEDAASNAAGETTRVDAGAFSAAAAGASDNDASIDWTSVSTTETYSHWSMWDTVGPAGGNPLLYGALTTSKAVTAGQDASFGAGDFDLDLD